MGQKPGLEFSNFDRELGDLRRAASKLQNATIADGPQLRAYLRALKTLNAKLSRNLDLLLPYRRAAPVATDHRPSESLPASCCGGH